MPVAVAGRQAQADVTTSAAQLSNSTHAWSVAAQRLLWKIVIAYPHVKTRNVESTGVGAAVEDVKRVHLVSPAPAKWILEAQVVAEAEAIIPATAFQVLNGTCALWK
jgi:hypothetical protein